MTLPPDENIYEDVWQSLGPAKFLLGRGVVRRMTDRVLVRWNPELLAASNGQAYDDQLEATARQAAEDTFGSVLVLLFIGLATAIVQVLLEWWLLDDFHRGLLMHMTERLK